jgi:hypothetical protein
MPAKENTTFLEFVLEIVYLVAFIALISVVVIGIDISLIGKIWRGSDRPTLEIIYVIRMVLSAVLAFAVVVVFIRLNSGFNSNPLINRLPSDHVPWTQVSLAARSRSIGIVLVLVFSLFYLAVFYNDPLQFRDISSDQKMVENLSAFFSMVACVIFIYIGLVQRKSVKTGSANSFYPALSWFFAALFFLIAMEETSWMQGIFF